MSNRGIEIEKRVCEDFGFDRVKCKQFDVYCPYGTPIEIKSCKKEYPSGRSGRFHIYKEAHISLLDMLNAKYMFVLTDENKEVLDWCFMSAEKVNDLISHWNDSSKQKRNTDELYKLSWVKVFFPGLEYAFRGHD